MTLHPQRDNDRLLFTTKTPHFFKIILDDTIKDGKLGIPKGFVRKYGNGLPNPILLKVPSGAVWQVELTMCDGDVWLQNGWPEFAEYYSLVHGHFLVFRYEEKSHFSVVIFDRSASEIKYPYTVTHGEEYSDGDGEFQEPMIEETEDNISIEILDDVLPCPKRREKSPLPCPLPNKLRRTNSTNKTVRSFKLQTFVSDIRPKGTHSKGKELEDFKGNIISQYSIQELGGGFNSPSKRGGEGTSTGCRGPQSKIIRRMQPLTANEKAERLQRASAFKSDNPFFAAAMQPSHVHPVYQLSIPTDFSRKYIIEKQGDIILYVSDGRTWSAKYRRGASNSNPRAKLYGGWREFVQDNHLEVGDVCVFELMNGTEMSLKVVVFRSIEDANCHLSPAEENGVNRVETKKSPVINIKSDCTSDDANGVPSLHHKSSTKKFQVPKIEDNENDISVEILDDFSPCPKAVEKSPSPYLQSHWNRETGPNGKSERISKTQTMAPPCSPEGLKSKELKLQKSKRNLNLHNSTRQIGDIRPKGTHSSGEELEDFKGNIISQCSTQELGGGFYSLSKNGEGTSTGCRGPQSKILKRLQSLTANEKSERLQRASAFKSDNPFFAVAMQPSSVHPKCQLSIPAAFARKYFIEKQGDVILYISDGRTWSAKYRRVASNGNPCAKLSGGWREFVQDNHLEVGDVCVFELMNGSKISLKVVILRSIEGANCHLSPGNQVKPMRSLVNEIDFDCTSNGDAGISSSLDQFTAEEFQLRQGPKVEHSNLEQLIHEESDGRQHTQRPSYLRLPGALEAANKFISEYPFFKVVVQRTNLEHCKVNVPSKFIQKLIKQKAVQILTLEVEYRSWPVKLIIYPHYYNRGRLSSGWTLFARENSLRLGDVCVFELIRSDDAVLKVSIFRCAG